MKRPIPRLRPLLLVWALLVVFTTGCAHLPFRSRTAHVAQVPATRGASMPALVAAPAQAAEITSVADVRVAEARTLFTSAPDRAEQALLAALAADPRHPAALGLLARLLHSQARYAEGVEALRVVREEPAAFAAPDRARLLATLALLQDALGETAAAREATALAHEASARESGPVALYLELHRPTAAGPEALSRSVERSAGRDAAALNNVGIAKLRRGDVDGARRAFESALERDAALPGPYYNLAILEQWWRHDRDAATRRFAQYWRLSHEDPDGLVAVFGDVVAAAAKPETGR